jgi:hypothetical protein
LPDAVPVKSYVIGAAAALFIMPPIAPATSASVTAERVFIALPDWIVLREMCVINSNIREMSGTKIVKVRKIEVNISETP